MYDTQGRGAIPPLLAALVTVFQMLEKVPDRQAAEFVASRLDWKYALHLPLAYPGFHFTDLWAFRQRLWEHAQERLLFEQLLAHLEALGLIKPQGKLRTDSTHVLALVERLSQLELVTESLRLALAAVAATAPAWAAQALPASLRAAYRERQSEYRLSPAEAQQRLAQAGQDGVWVLAQLDQHAPPPLPSLAEVSTLRTVLAQQFPQGPDQPPAQKRPSGEGVIEEPARARGACYGTKRGQHWIGYKLQVTETCDAEAPHLIVDLKPTTALENDAPQLPAIQARLRGRGLQPAEQQVDQGYAERARHIVRSAAQGIDLVGPPPQDTHPTPGFRQADFAIHRAAQQATCPCGPGEPGLDVWQPPGDGPPGIEIRFAGAVCQVCPAFGRCTTSPQGRSLSLHPYREALLVRRAEAATEAYRTKCHLRAGIEATISEVTVADGLRQARYRGLAKQLLQEILLYGDRNQPQWLARWWAGRGAGVAGAAAELPAYGLAPCRHGPGPTQGSAEPSHDPSSLFL